MQPKDNHIEFWSAAGLVSGFSQSWKLVFWSLSAPLLSKSTQYQQTVAEIKQPIIM